MEIYLLDGQTIISESYESIEQMLEEIGTSYSFIDVKIDGEDQRLIKGIDY